MLDDLERILVQLYATRERAQHLIDRVGIKAANVNLDGAMVDVWHAIIAEAISSQLLPELVRTASEDYPKRRELKRLHEVFTSLTGDSGNEEIMSDRWGNIDENTRMRDRIAALGERVAVLERDLRFLQDAILSLQTGQTANRTFTEKSFREVMDLQGELKQEISDLKVTIASYSVPSRDKTDVRRWFVGMGVGIALVLVAVLLVWIRLGMP